MSIKVSKGAGSIIIENVDLKTGLILRRAMEDDIVKIRNHFGEKAMREALAVSDEG